MSKSLPPWLTRVLAVVLLAGMYIIHHAGIIPATLAWHGINILGLVSDAVTGLAAIGISGPTLWPQLAAFLGNPAGAAKSAGVVVLLLAVGLSGCGVSGPVPPPGTPGITNCSDTALHQAELNILPNVESALASASWEQALLTIVAGIAGPLALSEVDCVVAYVENEAALASTATADSIEATKVSNARSWLAKHPANITGMAPVAR